ncbi:MAG: 6-bladed beta-propeller [Muribaculaceae bacterium]|nr:6-bladed beta-propeller [Muribaculaceae bacterium]
MNNIPLLISAACLFMTSCAGSENQSDIVFSTIDAVEGSDDLADYIEITNVVPLETSDSIVIGSITDIKKHGNDLYLLTGPNPFGFNAVLMKFSDTGKFKGQLSRLGDGPGEIHPFSTVSFDVSDNGIFINDYNRIQRYGHDGNFIGRVFENDIDIKTFILAGDKIVIAHGSDSLVCHAYTLDGVETAAGMPCSTIAIGAFLRPFSHLANGDILFHATPANDAAIYSPQNNTFREISITDIPGAQTAEAYESTVRINPEYGTKEGDFSGTLVITFSENGNDRILSTLNIKEGGDNLWLSKDGESTVKLSSYKDSATGKCINIANGYPLGDGVWVGAVTAEKLKDTAEENELAPALKSVADTIDAEANPVLVFYKLK